MDVTPTRPGRRLLFAAVGALIALAGALLVTPTAAHAAPPATPNFGRDIDDYQVRDPQTTCLPTEQPGVVDFRNLLNATYGNHDSGIQRGCHVGGPSEHKEGRALDYGLGISNATERAQAQELLDWLLAPDRYGNPHAMARRLGIWYVIFNKQEWSAASSNKTWVPYSCNPGAETDECHVEHIHFSFGWAGAKRQTSWWTGSSSFRQLSVAAQSGSGVVDAFWKTTGGMGHRWHVAGWHGPEVMPVGVLGSAPSAVVSRAGVVDVFWRGTDDNLWHRVFDGRSWLGQENLGMGPLGGPPVAVGQANGTVDVFWRGTDNGLWHAFYNPGQRWSGPHRRGHDVASDPSPVVTSAGVVDVFWKGRNGNLWHSYYNFGAWHGPQDLGMGQLGGPPRAVGQPDGAVDVFWRGSDDALWRGSYRASGGWSGPARHGGRLWSDPAPVVTATGVVDVFWRGDDDNLWHTYFNFGAWRGPENLRMGPLGGPPAAAGQRSGTVDVFWKGTDRAVWHAYFNPGHPWAGPERFGGVVTF